MTKTSGPVSRYPFHGQRLTSDLSAPHDLISTRLKENEWPTAPLLTQQQSWQKKTKPTSPTKVVNIGRHATLCLLKRLNFDVTSSESPRCAVPYLLAASCPTTTRSRVRRVLSASRISLATRIPSSSTALCMGHSASGHARCAPRCSRRGTAQQGTPANALRLLSLLVPR